MNCQEIRTAIDTASRRNPLNSAVKAHTAGCPDCRRHADESNALLALLGAQPRVQAPADFDFKLRARIAQAQVQPRGSVAVLQGFWTRSFSWVQAAAATTALALLATFTALQFTNHQESIDNSNGQNIATNTVSAPEATVPAPVETSTESQPAQPIANVKPAAVKFNVRATRPAAMAVKAETAILQPANSVASVAANDHGQRFYNRDKGQFVSAPARDLVGAESSATRMTKVSYVPSI